jgi:hypothetical protein
MLHSAGRSAFDEHQAGAASEARTPGVDWRTAPTLLYGLTRPSKHQDVKRRLEDDTTEYQSTAGNPLDRHAVDYPGQFVASLHSLCCSLPRCSPATQTEYRDSHSYNSATANTAAILHDTCQMWAVKPKPYRRTLGSSCTIIAR